MMAISEKKMQIVMNNYFKAECTVNTSIREAFEKGFRIGVQKGYDVTKEPERTAKVEWSEVDGCHLCGECGFAVCPNCDVYCAGCGVKLDWSGNE